MDRHTTIHNKTERVLIETDELIFPVRTEQVFYAEISDSNTIRFYEADSSYQFSGSKTVIDSFLKLTGFIRVQSHLYINPHQISEYIIKDHIVKFPTGTTVDIHPKFKKPLFAFFLQRNSLSV